MDEHACDAHLAILVPYRVEHFRAVDIFPATQGAEERCSALQIPQELLQVVDGILDRVLTLTLT